MRDFNGNASNREARRRWLSLVGTSPGGSAPRNFGAALLPRPGARVASTRMAPAPMRGNPPSTAPGSWVAILTRRNLYASLFRAYRFCAPTGFTSLSNCRPRVFKRFHHFIAPVGLTALHQFYHLIALSGFAVLPFVPIFGFSGFNVSTISACALPVLPFYPP